MVKSDIFWTICDKVSEVFKVSVDGIMRDMRDKDYDKDTLNKKARTVNNIYCSYMTRCEHDDLFCLLSVDVKKWLKETYGIGKDY